MGAEKLLNCLKAVSRRGIPLNGGLNKVSCLVGVGDNAAFYSKLSCTEQLSSSV